MLNSGISSAVPVAGEEARHSCAENLIGARVLPAAHPFTGAPERRRWTRWRSRRWTRRHHAAAQGRRWTLRRRPRAGVAWVRVRRRGGTEFPVGRRGGSLLAAGAAMSHAPARLAARCRCRSRLVCCPTERRWQGRRQGRRRRGTLRILSGGCDSVWPHCKSITLNNFCI
jgi:hypothetical protein